jgi:hypothetical protein
MTVTAPSEGRKIGVGVAFQGATGLSVYADADSSHFVQAAAAWGATGAYSFTGDYAFDYPHAFNSAPILTPYWGIGVAAVKPGEEYWIPRYTYDDHTGTDAGLRIPLGLNLVIPKTPVQLGVELAPTVIVTPVTYSYLQGGVDARVLF